MSVNFPVAGSYIESWRLDACSGNTCADGWLDLRLQKAGFGAGRILAVNQTRPFSSIIGLCVTLSLSQIGSAPQYGEGSIGAVFVVGVFGSRTGCLISLTELCAGSSTGSSRCSPRPCRKACRWD
jgi:hypothetical protein